jgi:hypothetical protein
MGNGFNNIKGDTYTMEDYLIDARIASRVMDNMSAKEILKETIEDCDGDESKAKKMIRAFAEEQMRLNRL